MIWKRSEKWVVDGRKRKLVGKGYKRTKVAALGR